MEDEEIEEDEAFTAEDEEKYPELEEILKRNKKGPRAERQEGESEGEDEEEENDDEEGELYFGEEGGEEGAADVGAAEEFSDDSEGSLPEQRERRVSVVIQYCTEEEEEEMRPEDAEKLLKAIGTIRFSLSLSL
jgi:hypothetical protein